MFVLGMRFLLIVDLFSLALSILSTWKDSDSVEIYLGSHLLNTMRLSETERFDVHHQAVLFHNFRARRWLTVDFFMNDDSEIPQMFVTTGNSVPPNWGPLEYLYSYISGALYEHFFFENFGQVRILETMVRKPADFDENELQHIGSARGGAVAELTEWILKTYDGILQFDVFAIYMENGIRVRKSKTCFDFVEDVLAKLVWEPKAYIVGDDLPEIAFREGVVLNVTKLEKVDMSVPKRRRDYFRFARVLWNHMHQIGAHLVYIRLLMVKVAEMDLEYMLALDGWEMHSVEFSSDAADNHCALPLEFERDGTPISANLGDFRRVCFLPSATRAEWARIIQYSWSDWAIWAEAKIDNWLVGRDGSGGVLSYFDAILGAAILMIIVSKIGIK